MENEFPPNSRLPRPETKREPAMKEEKQVQRVVKGRVHQRRKSLGKRILETFRPDDTKGVVEYMLMDILIPGVRRTIGESLISGVEQSIIGDSGVRRGGNYRGSGGRGYTSYNRMSERRPDPRDRDRDRDRDRRPARKAREVFDQEVILESRVEANHVLDSMYELLSKYDVVSVRDLLSLLGEPHTFTDEDWGWQDLRGARVHSVGRGGYLLDLPRPEPLD